MRKVVVLSLSIFTLLSLESCVTVQIAPADGEYSGKFTVLRGKEKQEGDVEIVLKSGEYSSSSNPNFVPAGGSGTYVIEGDSILFVDEKMYIANFDWNMLLNGKYSYEVKKGNLNLSVTKEDGSVYTYKLHKK